MDFGEFILEENEKLKIIAYETEDYEDGLSVASYDISLGERSELYDVAKISLPYDVSRIDQANEAISVEQSTLMKKNKSGKTSHTQSIQRQNG